MTVVPSQPENTLRLTAAAALRGMLAVSSGDVESTHLTGMPAGSSGTDDRLDEVIHL
jgi:hypothetical protein